MLEQPTVVQPDNALGDMRVRIKYNDRINPGFIGYLKAMKEFTARDWIIYITWVGVMFGLFVATLSFLILSSFNNADFPVYVWLIPIGILTFTFAIFFDTIAHMVIYKQWLSDAEWTVHRFATSSGVLTVFALIAGFDFPVFMQIPIYVFAALSILYSLIDEMMHWIRYAQGGSGWLEVTMHFLILVGHTTMVVAWILWYEQGYPGVAETIAALGL